MPETWLEALRSYSYPVDLSNYDRANQFPGFFENIIGCRDSTIGFETYFRERAPNHIEVFFEVVFWKLYSQPHIRNGSTNRIVDFILNHGVTAQLLWGSVQRFLANPNISTLRQIRVLLGLKTKVLAVPLTLCAFAKPEKFPLIDMQVARWVNSNADVHNQNRINQLGMFNMRYTSLKDDDFPNYLNWVAWCREVSLVLTRLTKTEWRARDVELAVFTVQRNGSRLNVLP